MSALRKDCRLAFLSKENRYLLDFVANYASSYVKGGNGERCDACGSRFKPIVSRWLYCLVPKGRTDKFSFVCLRCWEREGVIDEFHYFELYPRVRMSDIWQMCRLGVFKKFHFKIDPDRYHKPKEVRIEDTRRDLLATMRELVRGKKPHEQIESIKLRTYGGLVFEERFEDAVMERNELLRATPGRSQLATLLESGFVFENRTYIYVVQYREYPDAKPYQVFVDRECEFFCKRCTFKKRYLGNPILFCSRCGNTDSKYNYQFNMDNVEYDPDRLTWKTYKLKHFILYYDISDCKDRIRAPDYKSDWTASTESIQ